MLDALEREKANNAELQEQLNYPKEHDDKEGRYVLIPRPEGTAGSTYSIQDQMGLAGDVGTKKYDQYKAIQVCIKQVHNME